MRQTSKGIRHPRLQKACLASRVVQHDYLGVGATRRRSTLTCPTAAPTNAWAGADLRHKLSAI